MVYCSLEVETMRLALKLAEQTIDFAFASGVDLKTREMLAKAIVTAMAEGLRDAALLSQAALRSISDPAVHAE